MVPGKPRMRHPPRLRPSCESRYDGSERRKGLVVVAVVMKAAVGSDGTGGDGGSCRTRDPRRAIFTKFVAWRES